MNESNTSNPLMMLTAVLLAYWMKATRCITSINKNWNPDKASIAHDILHYITYGLNMSMQIIRNCSLRVSCISKLKIHYDSLVNNLAELDPENLTNVRCLAKDVSLYKQCLWEYSSKCRSGSGRAISKAYSMVVKQEGIKFPDLVERYKNKLGYEGEFESLEEAQKLEVYNSIIGPRSQK